MVPFRPPDRNRRFIGGRTVMPRRIAVHLRCAAVAAKTSRGDGADARGASAIADRARCVLLPLDR